MSRGLFFAIILVVVVAGAMFALSTVDSERPLTKVVKPVAAQDAG